MSDDSDVVDDVVGTGVAGDLSKLINAIKIIEILVNFSNL